MIQLIKVVDDQATCRIHNVEKTFTIQPNVHSRFTYRSTYAIAYGKRDGKVRRYPIRLQLHCIDGIWSLKREYKVNKQTVIIKGWQHK